MTFIQAGMRQKQGSKFVHRPENGRQSAPGLSISACTRREICGESELNL